MSGRSRPLTSAKRRLRGAAIRLVIFAAVSVLFTTVVVATLLDLDTRGTNSYSAIFTDATGLQSGQVVRIAGVEVGKVDAVSLHGRDAKVNFTVNADQRLTTTTLAQIHFENLLGQRFLELTAGPTPGVALPAGATIPVSRTVNGLDLTELFDGFQPLFSALTPAQINQLTGSLIEVLQGQGGTVGQLVDQIGALTNNLAARQQVINAVLDNLTPLLDTVSNHDAQLGQLISSLDTLVQGLAGERGQLGTAITSVGQLTSNLSNVLGQSQPALDSDITGLTTAAGTLAANQKDLNGVLGGLPGFLSTLVKVTSSGNFASVYICNLTFKAQGPLAVSLDPDESPKTIPVPTGPVGDQTQHTANCK